MDWDTKTVIGSKSRATPKAATEKDVNAARRSGAAIETERKGSTLNKTTAKETDHQRIAALDRTDEPTAPKPISKDVGKAMQDARKTLDMTQKDLAVKVNEKVRALVIDLLVYVRACIDRAHSYTQPTVIQDYEQGKAIPSPQVLAKLEKALKVKLRGKDIGQPMLSVSEKKAQAAKK
jgi:putative transcription factor